MARTAIAVQSVPRNTAAAVTLSAADSANGMVFPNDGSTELHVVNGSGSAVTVTAVSIPCSHGRSGDLAFSVAAGAKAVLGPFDPHLFNQSGGVGGNVNVNFSASASVTVGAVTR